MSEIRDLKIIEALLFASGEPVPENDLVQKIIAKDNISKYLEDLKNFYKNRGINLVKTGNKWSFRTSSEVKDELVIFKTISSITSCIEAAMSI